MIFGLGDCEAAGVEVYRSYFYIGMVSCSIQLARDILRPNEVNVAGRSCIGRLGSCIALIDVAIMIHGNCHSNESEEHWSIHYGMADSLG